MQIEKNFEDGSLKGQRKTPIIEKFNFPDIV